VQSASGYKIGKFRALQLLADSKIEARSTEVGKNTFLLEVYLHGENVAARQEAAWGAFLPHPACFSQGVRGVHLTHHCFLTKTKTASLGSGRPRRRSEPSSHPLMRTKKGKDTKVSSLARISYGAQELAVYPPCRFTFPF
jgi:hypothetical protein